VHKTASNDISNVKSGSTSLSLNPWTDRHQIWNTWLRRGYLLPKNWVQSALGVL